MNIKVGIKLIPNQPILKEFFSFKWWFSAQHPQNFISEIQLGETQWESCPKIANTQNAYTSNLLFGYFN